MKIKILTFLKLKTYFPLKGLSKANPIKYVFDNLEFLKIKHRMPHLKVQSKLLVTKLEILHKVKVKTVRFKNKKKINVKP